MTGPEPSSSSQSAGEPRVVVERPPPGLARGKYAWPPLGIAALGGIVLLLGIAFLLWRRRRRSTS